MVDHYNFNLNNNNYYCDVFSFLRQTIPPVLAKNQRPTRITCLDVSTADLVLGSNVGTVFAFRRRTQITNSPHFTASIFTSPISHVRVTSIPGLIAAASNSTLVLWSLYDEKQVYRVNLCPRNSIHSNDSRPVITCLYFFQNESHVKFYAGMSNGQVIQVQTSISDANVSAGVFEIETIFTETDESVTLDHLTHKIVQLDVLSADRLLISSCYRTVILESDRVSGASNVIQVGKNQRSTCASYGACFMKKCNSVFAARPSSHLLVADPATGAGQKTFILKRSPKPDAIDAFDRLRGQRKEHATAPLLILGRLAAVDSDIIVSWNKSSFFMVDTSGALLMDERNIDIIGLSVVISTGQQGDSQHDQFEIFLLSSQMILLRIMNFTFNDENNSILSSGSYSGSDDFSVDEPSVASFLPVNLTSTFNTLLNGLKARSYSSESSTPSRFAVGSEQISLENFSNNHQEAASQLENSSEQLVIARKKFAGPKTTSSRVKVTKSKKKKETSGSSKETATSNVSLTDVKDSSSNYNSTLYESIPGSDFTEKDLQHASVDESERLLQILKAYNAERSNAITQVGDSPLQPSILAAQEENASEAITNHDVRHHEPPLPTTSTSLEEEGENAHLSPDVSPPNGPLTSSDPFVFPILQLPSQEEATDTNNCSEKYDLVFLEWTVRVPEEKKNKLDLSSVVQICALQDEMRDGLAILTNTAKDWFIYIYPGSRKIKCPNSKSKVRTFHVSSSQIVLLYQDGSLYRASDWLTKSLFCLGPKFTKAEFKRCNCLVDISCNVLDQVTWACDQDGFGWILRSTDSATFLARDDSSPQVRVTTVTVSPRNSAIVWALDVFSRLYVRSGIFNEKGDMDTLIGGIDWILVDDVPGRVNVISPSKDSIWIVCEIDGKDRLFKRLGIDPPKNYLGTEWQEYSLPVGEKIRCISGNLTPVPESLFLN